jgi:type IV pilus assembly protein PilP
MKFIPKFSIQLLLINLLIGCSSSGRYADIDAFMADVNERPKGQIAPLPEFQPYQPFAYGSSNRRSPFEPPIIIPPKTKDQVKNIGVKPPENHVRQYLERFNVASLSMVGTLTQEADTWGLILDAEGGVHRVQIGDYLGTNWGRIDEISTSRVSIIEIVNDGAGGWLERPRGLELNSN